jgi:hypothetical protein
MLCDSPQGLNNRPVQSIRHIQIGCCEQMFACFDWNNDLDNLVPKLECPEKTAK